MLVQNDLDNQPMTEQNSMGSSLGSSVGSSMRSFMGSPMGSSVETSCQDYQIESLENFDDAVYTTRSADKSIKPPVAESIRPGKQPKITDNEVRNPYLAV